MRMRLRIRIQVSRVRVSENENENEKKCANEIKNFQRMSIKMRPRIIATSIKIVIIHLIPGGYITDKTTVFANLGL